MQRNDPLRLSASAARAFLECPYRFARLHVDRLPDNERGPVPSLAFGSAVHGALADFIRQGGREALALDDLIGLLMRHWEGGVYPDSDTELYHFHRAKEMLTRFYDSPYPVSVEKELAVEQYVTWRVARKGLLATGKLDRACLVAGNVLEIVDYKTGNWIPKDEDLKNDQQALFYRTLGADRFREHHPAAIRVTFFYLAIGEARSVEYEHEDFLARWREVEALGHAIKMALELLKDGRPLVSAFPLNRSTGCSRCPMVKHCDRLDESQRKEGA